MPENGQGVLEQFFEILGSRPAGLLVDPTSAVSQDGKRLARCEGGVVNLFDVGSGARPDARRGSAPDQHGARLHGRLEGHSGYVYCVAFSPDGARIATGGNDATVRIWDARSCEMLLVLRGHEQYVKHVAYSPDGTMLASASGDTTIRPWDTKPLHERRAMGRRR